MLIGKKKVYQCYAKSFRINKSDLDKGTQEKVIFKKQYVNPIPGCINLEDKPIAQQEAAPHRGTNELPSRTTTLLLTTAHAVG